VRSRAISGDLGRSRGISSARLHHSIAACPRVGQSPRPASRGERSTSPCRPAYGEAAAMCKKEMRPAKEEVHGRAYGVRATTAGLGASREAARRQVADGAGGASKCVCVCVCICDSGGAIPPPSLTAISSHPPSRLEVEPRAHVEGAGRVVPPPHAEHEAGLDAGAPPPLRAAVRVDLAPNLAPPPRRRPAASTRARAAARIAGTLGQSRAISGNLGYSRAAARIAGRRRRTRTKRPAAARRRRRPARSSPAPRR